MKNLDPEEVETINSKTDRRHVKLKYQTTREFSLKSSKIIFVERYLSVTDKFKLKES